MALQFGPTKIGGMQYNGVTIGEAMYNGHVVYRSGLPVVTITGSSANVSREQFRQACIDYGTTYQTVQVLPFLLDTSQATNTSYMFWNCSALTQVPDLDTGNVTNMGYMFWECSSLTQVPNLDTASVTTMTQMFQNCSSLTQVPDLDTGNVTDMSYMFRDCSSLTQAPDLDTANVTSMGYMFDGCSSLAQVPDLDTAKVTSTAGMFRNCSALTDGNVRLIGKHPSVITALMISGSGLTREPFLGAEGTITGRTLTNNTLTTLATHTITAAEGGNLKLLLMTLAWGNATATKSIRIDRNGVQVATATGQKPAATVEVVCNVGDVITYKATVNSTTTANRVINSGTWGAWNR